MGIISNNLPLQLSSFIGRERDLAEVERLLATSRLVTLTGAGGCGKTRLAIQSTKRVSHTFADGVWWVDLAPLHEPTLIPQLVAQTFGLRQPPDQPLIESLLNFVRPKHILLILDNCEHLLAACAQLVQQLLFKAPALQILATSREVLAVAGETIYPVSGLAWPPFSRETVRDGQRNFDQDFMPYDAVRLFVERAAAISPHFSLTSDNALVIVEICRRLDGIPLALELASARVNVLTVQQIAARLDDRFALLTSGQRTALVSHHHTLRAAIDWSYALLTAEEQLLLRRLAVFEAGCALNTAEAVCSGEGISVGHILDLLSSLVDKSLIVAETTSRAEARYRFLETIRDYALEKLAETGETGRLRDRHLDLFLARAEEAEPKLFDAYQQLWLNWLEGEHDNLRAALAWALEAGRIEAGLRLAIALYRFWEIRSYMQEGLAWFERLLSRADEGISLVIRANGFTSAGFLAMFLGHTSAAMEYGQQAVALAEAAGDEGKPILAFALAGLASSVRAAGDYESVFALQGQSIQLYRELGDAYGVGMGVLVQGLLATRLGRYDMARELLNEGLTLAREADDTFRIALAYNFSGDLARCEQNYTLAQSAYENSVALLRELGAARNLAGTLHNLGHIYLHLGDAERAHALFSESMATQQAQQNRSGMAEGLIGFAALAVGHGWYAAGVRLLAAVAAVVGGERGVSEWPATQMDYEHSLALARAKLTEAEFQAEQATGQVLSLEQAIEYAQNLPLLSKVTPASREKPDGLTEREREVATLIGLGKSNGEIASELVLSKRTVEKHVANILDKLALSSRAQIVRWAIENNLT